MPPNYKLLNAVTELTADLYSAHDMRQMVHAIINSKLNKITAQRVRIPGHKILDVFYEGLKLFKVHAYYVYVTILEQNESEPTYDWVRELFNTTGGLQDLLLNCLRQSATAYNHELIERN